jgi:hypothetical protein
MLTVIDYFAGCWMFIGGGAAAKIRAPFKQGDTITGFAQCTSRGEAGQTAANNRNCGRNLCFG